MSYRIEVTPKAQRELAGLASDVCRTVVESIEALADVPRPRGAKRLKGVRDVFRIRVGDYRILYRINDAVLEILVVRIGNRKEVYRRLTSL